MGKVKSMSEMKPCPILYPQKIEVEDKTVDTTNLPKCTAPKIYDHCSARPDTDETFLHLAFGPIPDQFFGFLHHPSSPTKWTFVITQTIDWKDKDLAKNDCDEIYLTRTGSRSNQPNKCIAVARVPEGVASIVQHQHRYGVTAGHTDQFMSDFARGNCFKEEQALLAPLLHDLDALNAEFIKKMGSPLNADGSRKAAIIMVANEGVMELLLNFICSAEGIATTHHQ